MTKETFDISEVTRIEVINHTKKGDFGRVFTYWSEYGNGVENPQVDLALQDNGRTLKIFISEKTAKRLDEYETKNKSIRDNS